jgi:sulfide:quinone oxidoreductase
MNLLVAGGGVAALETLLALRGLAAEQVDVTLLAPESDFFYRPLSVAEPFGGHAKRYPLWRVAQDTEATLVADGLAEVRPGRHEVVCTSGEVRGYDALVLATGARAVPAFSHALTFGGDDAKAAFGTLLADLTQGFAHRLAFVVPPETGWTLPLYELAMMTARELWTLGIENVRLWFVTHEKSPLAIFGEAGSRAMGELLAPEGIEFVGSTSADVREGAVLLDPRGQRIEVDRIVCLPRFEGLALAGVPHDIAGFLEVDDHGRVLGVEDVFAAGDGTAYPIKQGGLATQQADAVAETIAHDAGVDLQPKPFRPVLRGRLLPSGSDRYLTRTAVSEDGDSSTSALWWPPAKVAGRYLAPYLHGRDGRRRSSGCTTCRISPSRSRSRPLNFGTMRLPPTRLRRRPCRGQRR